MKKNTIIALTTDPYDNLYGYSLVFLRIFDYLERICPQVKLHVATTSGLATKLVDNKSFTQIEINKHNNLLIKTVVLFFNFLQFSLRFDKKSIVIVNAEIPEMLAGFFLKLKYKNVYCFIYDTRVRKKGAFPLFVCYLRTFLANRIGKVIFCNRYTMNHFNSNVKKYYIGTIVI